MLFANQPRHDRDVPLSAIGTPVGSCTLHTMTDTSQPLSLFEQRQVELVAGTPALGILRDRLLAIAGDRVALRHEPDLAAILESGVSFDVGDLDVAELNATARSANVELRPGPVSRCHSNASYLASVLNAGILVTGWALSDDACWRQHSWVTASDGRIIETTTPRVAYFGVPITDPADLVEFAWENWDTATVAAYGPPSAECG